MKLITSIMSALAITTAMAQQAVDVHCHNVLPEFTAFLDEHGAALEETFPLPHWDVKPHLEFMDKAGISRSLLSMPAPQPYYGDTDESERIIRLYNEKSAELKKEYPDRFMFCASVPLPDVEAAVGEAVYALDSLGADGIKLATNSRGQYVGDPALDPLMQALDERRAVVILHPHKPTPVNDSIIAAAPLAIYEYPAETTRTIINMIAHNVPARYPNIRFVVPHCGSFLPLAIPRMKAVLPAMIAKGLMQPVDWEANTRNLYYDLAGGVTLEILRSLLTITTPDHLLYGSDYPYQPAEVLAANLQRLRATLAADPELAPYADDILAANAMRLLGHGDTTEAAPAPAPKAAMCAKEPMQADGIVRLSTVEVYPQYLDEYKRYAAEVGEVSLRTEPGVLTMYAVQENDNPCIISILETYASHDAYKKHIASPHFQKYKQGTLHMVKNLMLSDQTPLNPANRITNYIK